MATINSYHSQVLENPINLEIDNAVSKDAFLQSIFPVLETYSNVHRGSGHNSIATTRLFDQARKIVLDYLGLTESKHVVFFFSPLRAHLFVQLLKPGSFNVLSCLDFGLHLGVRAVVVEKKALPKHLIFQPGGGATKLYSRKWVIWAGIPDRLESGTPAVFNIVAFAKAILLSTKKNGNEVNTVKSYSVNEIFYDNQNSLSGRELLVKLRQSFIGSKLQVPTTEGLKPFINLDNSASTRTFLPVWNAFAKAYSQPKSTKDEIIAETKKICARFLGAPESGYEIIFTSNTTESINLLAGHYAGFKVEDAEPVILTSILEHSSNDLPWRMVPGCSVERLEVDKEGFWDIEAIEKILVDYNQKGMFGKKRIKLVALNGASNVVGICNNLSKVGHLVHKYGASLMVDAAQLVAHRPIAMESCGIDFLAFSAHKVYAPFGCGVLVSRKGLMNFKDQPSEMVKSSGEENAGGIAALGKALLLLEKIGFNTIIKEEQMLVYKTMQELAKIPGIKIFGIKDADSPRFDDKIGVIAFEIKNMIPGSVAKKLAFAGGIGVRFGCHCAHLIVKHVLNFTPAQERFQRFVVKLVPPLKLQGFVRVSFGLENTMEDVNRFIDVLRKIAIRDKSLVTDKNVMKKISLNFEEEVASRIYGL